MLLYIHTQTTTYIYRTSKTNKQAQLKNAYGLEPQPYPHLTKALQGDASKFPPQSFSFSAPATNT